MVTIIVTMIISVIGAGSCDNKTYVMAEDVGRLVARRGAILITGGLGGVMEAACKGAKANNGTTIGILPGDDPDHANPYVDIPVATGLGHGRNLIIINTAQSLIAISGKYGTLSEISFGLQSGKPVFGLGTWDIDGVIICGSPDEAVKKAIKGL